jgi:hypothetical protein
VEGERESRRARRQRRSGAGSRVMRWKDTDVMTEVLPFVAGHKGVWGIYDDVIVWSSLFVY